MADTKTLEREYVVPLRRHWLHVPHYERTGKAIKAIKIFIAKHMKVDERDIDKVKLDVYFNNNLWFKGRANPPSKVKVKARREGDLVHVTFFDVPEHVTFLKSKHLKIHSKPDSSASSPVAKAEVPSEKKSDEEKTEEKEKEKAVAEHNLQEADKAVKAQKNVAKVEKANHPHRMALKK